MFEDDQVLNQVVSLLAWAYWVAHHGLDSAEGLVRLSWKEDHYQKEPRSKWHLKLSKLDVTMNP